MDLQTTIEAKTKIPFFSLDFRLLLPRFSTWFCAYFKTLRFLSLGLKRFLQKLKRNKFYSIRINSRIAFLVFLDKQN